MQKELEQQLGAKARRFNELAAAPKAAGEARQPKLEHPKTNQQQVKALTERLFVLQQQRVLACVGQCQRAVAAQGETKRKDGNGVQDGCSVLRWKMMQ